MKKMICCKTCGAEIAKNADICPNCGAKRKIGLKIVSLIVVFFGFFVLFWGIYSVFFSGYFYDDNPNEVIQGTNADIINSEGTVSLSEYNIIEIGMTYTEVCNIIGGEGTLMSAVNLFEGEYKTEMYEWTGDGIIGANAHVTFQDGKVVSKAQFGLR